MQKSLFGNVTVTLFFLHNFPFSMSNGLGVSSQARFFCFLMQPFVSWK